MSRLPVLYYQIQGTLPFKILELHNKYGPIVRIAPGELSFTSESAWDDIYGRLPGKAQLQKTDEEWVAPPSGVVGLGPYGMPDEKHSQLRYGYCIHCPTTANPP
jgi:hypothetical protein